MNLKLTQPSIVTQKTRFMGVLNITPDSFSDGGRFFDKTKAVRRGIEIENQGASIIDIGGESTRPGSRPVSIDEELDRVIPVIEALKSKINIPISIDTNKPIVAREAINAGASIINDIMGISLSKEMADVAAKFNTPLILMHIKGEPRTMQLSPVYNDLIGEIISGLKKAIEAAISYGVDPSKIIIDPGIGFGKTYLHNIEILRRLQEFKILNKPILVGPSRKSFIGTILDIKDPDGRLMGTAAAIAIAIINGADIIRVHDVKEMVQVGKLVDAAYKNNDDFNVYKSRF